MRRAALGIAASFGLALGASAQPAPAAAPSAAPATAEPAPPTPIPIPSLVIEAEAADSFSRSAAAWLTPRPEIVAIERALAQLEPRLQEREGQTNAQIAERASLFALDAEASYWRQMRLLLASWRQAPTDRLVALERWIDELHKRTEIWSATRTAAREGEAPPEALRRIASVLSALSRAQGQANKARRSLVDLQARITGREANAALALERLAEAHRLERAALLLRNSVPVWAAFQRHREVAAVVAEVRGRIAAELEVAKLYARLSGARFALQGLLFAASILLARSIRPRTEALKDDPRLAGSSIIFDRYVSSALLLALAFAPLIHPAAPSLLGSALQVALIPVVLRLLPALVDRAIAPTIWPIALCAALDLVRVELASADAVERGLFLIELAAASGTLLWMMRPARLTEIRDPSQVPRGLQLALRTALGLLLGSLVASSLGWTNLAHLVGSGTLRSAYAALVLYGGARVVRASLRALVQSQWRTRSPLLRDHGAAVIQQGTRVANSVGLVVWAALTLAGVGLWDGFVKLVSELWTHPLGFGSLSISLGSVLTFFLTLLVAVTLSRLLRFVLEADVLTRFDSRRGLSHALSRTAQYVVLLLGFYVAATAAGIDMNRFTLLAGALGVGIGFGLQNIVNNFVSGLILLFERPIQVGDAIEVGGVLGDVTRIGVRSSTLRTAQGAEVIVPNATLIAERVVNWTFTDRARRSELRVGVAYGSDLRRVMDVLVASAKAQRGVLPYPAPTALFLGFGESSLSFELRFWTQFDQIPDTPSEVAIAAHAALKEAGIELPFPQRDLHVRSLDPGVAQSLAGTRK